MADSLALNPLFVGEAAELRRQHDAIVALSEALESLLECDADAVSARGKPKANLNGVGLVDLFDHVGHPFGVGPNKQQPGRSVSLAMALDDARATLTKHGVKQ